MPLRSFTLVLVLLAATLVAAQEPEAVPRFFIESVSVEGVRWASARVIVAETRLQPGRDYTESELRDAAARATRLPFVLRVEPRIERGTHRGTYRLVLAVTETKPFFFGGTYLDEHDQPDVRQLTLGARRFAGRSGMLHGAATTLFDDQLYELGYTQYDLFGSGVFVAATLEYGEIPSDLGRVYHATLPDRLTANVVAGVPLRGNHALRATFLSAPLVVFSEKPRQELTPANSGKIERATTAELSWIYDSTDDPLFTTRGIRSIVGAGRRNVPFVVPLHPVALRSNQHHRWLTAELRRAWSLAPRHTILAQAGLTSLRRDFGPTGYDLEHSPSFGATYAYSLFGPDRPSPLGDLRLETGLVHERSYFKDDFDQDSSGITAARVGLLFRSEWGVVRLRFDLRRHRE